MSLQGYEIGNLTPLMRYPNKNAKNQYLWMCRCVCGNYAVVSENALTTKDKRKARKSCGCDGSPHRPFFVIDTHKKYGMLQIIEFQGFTQNEPVFLCQCDCSNLIQTTLFKLRREKIHSCGCRRKEANCINLSKMRFDGTNIARISRTTPLNSNSSSSGRMGVTWNNQKQKWNAYLRVKGKLVLHRYFDDLQEAIDARIEAEEKYLKPILFKYKQDS